MSASVVPVSVVLMSVLVVDLARGLLATGPRPRRCIVRRQSSQLLVARVTERKMRRLDRAALAQMIDAVQRASR